MTNTNNTENTMAQGFANHETELATRWLQSTPDEYKHWTERTEEILRGYPSKGKTTSQGDALKATAKLSKELREAFDYSEYHWSEEELVAVLLKAALHRVNWTQIARGLVESAEFNNTFPLEEHITTQE